LSFFGAARLMIGLAKWLANAASCDCGKGADRQDCPRETFSSASCSSRRSSPRGGKIGAPFLGTWEVRFSDGSIGTGLWHIAATAIRYEDPSATASAITFLEVRASSLAFELHVRTGDRRSWYNIELRPAWEGGCLVGAQQEQGGAASAFHLWPQASNFDISPVFCGQWEVMFEDGMAGTGLWTIAPHELRYDDPTMVDASAISCVRCSRTELLFHLRVGSAASAEVYDLSLSPSAHEGCLLGRQARADGSSTKATSFQLLKKVPIDSAFHGVWEVRFQNGAPSFGTWTIGAHDVRYDDPTVESVQVHRHHADLGGRLLTCTVHLHDLPHGHRGTTRMRVQTVTLTPAPEGALCGELSETGGNEILPFVLVQKVPVDPVFHGLWEVRLAASRLGAGTWSISAYEVLYEDCSADQRRALVVERLVRPSQLLLRLLLLRPSPSPGVASQDGQLLDCTLRPWATDGGCSSLEGLMLPAINSSSHRGAERWPTSEDKLGSPHWGGAERGTIFSGEKPARFRMNRMAPIIPAFHGAWRARFDDGELGSGTWSIGTTEIRYDDASSRCRATVGGRVATEERLSFQLRLGCSRYEIALRATPLGRLEGEQVVDGGPGREKFHMVRVNVADPSGQRAAGVQVRASGGTVHL